MLALGVGGFSSPAQAAETGTHVHDPHPASDKSWGEIFKDIWTRDKLTGDWGGLRTDLAKHGIGIDFNLAQFYQGVASGGEDTEGRYGGLMNTILNVDGHKLGLWEGIYFNLHAQTRFGKDILAEAGSLTLTNAALLYPLPGDFAGTNITGVMASQVLFGGRAAVLAGKLNAFDIVDGLFPHITDGGLKGFMNVNSMLSALPWIRWVNLSMYGAAAWTMEQGQPTTGLIALGQNNQTDNWSGFNDSFNDGVGLLGFHRFLFSIDEKPGYVFIGGGGSTKKYNSADQSDWVVRRRTIPVSPSTNLVVPAGLADTGEKHPWGAALYWYQVFWQAAGNDKRFANFFVGGSVADNNPSFADGNVFLSLQGFGLFASRPHDRMGIAGSWNHLSDDYVDLLSRLPNTNLQHNLYTFEVYYNIAINPWLHLTPDFQLARNANKKDNLAVIPGVRLVMDF